jgi:YebC/PmpR family DNA-binding regulatory protein
MSGHSKWATTKRRKGAQDSKRSSLFTKLANVITIAARKGGDPTMNFSLRMAVDRAKSFSMPKENIDRAIKRGTGELGGITLEEIVYEGYGPGQVAFVIETLTDNRNRTVSEIKHIFDDHHGTLGNSGTVMWLFEKKGVFVLVTPSFSSEKLNLEELELKIIDAGADDFEITDDKIYIYTKLENMNQVKENLEKNGITITDAKIEYLAKEKIEISDETGEQIQNLFDALDEHQDVSEYYTNLK